MQLGNYYPLGSVDNKSTPGGHIGNVTQEYVLNNCLEIDVFLIITAQTKFGLQGNSISQSSFHTLFNGVTGRIDKIIQKLQYENVPGISNRKIVFKHTEQTFDIPLVRSSF